MTQHNKLSDESNDNKYSIQVPHLVIALCRNPYDYTLWNVVKMVVGEYPECILSTSDLAKLAMMSEGKVSDSRSYLLAVGLLVGKCYRDPGYPQPVWHLRIPDIWLNNYQFRQTFGGLKNRVELKKYLKDIFDRAGIYRDFNIAAFQQLPEVLHTTSLHNMKPSYSESSPKEPSYSESSEREPSYSEQGVSRTETIKKLQQQQLQQQRDDILDRIGKLVADNFFDPHVEPGHAELLKQCKTHGPQKVLDAIELALSPGRGNGKPKNWNYIVAILEGENDDDAADRRPKKSISSSGRKTAARRNQTKPGADGPDSDESPNRDAMGRDASIRAVLDRIDRGELSREEGRVELGRLGVGGQTLPGVQS